MPISKNTPPRECVVCAKPFVPRSKGQIACSHACGHIAKRKNADKKCPACGVTFRGAYATQKFCSFACASTAKRKDRNVVCAKCGVTFERPHGKQRVYCSRRCAAKVINLSAAKPSGYKRVTASGYVMLKIGNTWRQEHRVVMEHVLCRPLQAREYVHHRNGNRADNRVENLELWAAKSGGKKDPPGQRVEDLIGQIIGHFRLSNLDQGQKDNLRLVLDELLN